MFSKDFVSLLLKFKS